MKLRNEPALSKQHSASHWTKASKQRKKFFKWSLKKITKLRRIGFATINRQNCIMKSFRSTTSSRKVVKFIYLTDKCVQFPKLCIFMLLHSFHTDFVAPLTLATLIPECPYQFEIDCSQSVTAKQEECRIDFHYYIHRY